jgi:hypothetical protein
MSALAFCGQPKNGLDDRTCLEIRAVELVAASSPRRNYVRLVVLTTALQLLDPRLGGAPVPMPRKMGYRFCIRESLS